MIIFVFFTTILRSHTSLNETVKQYWQKIFLDFVGSYTTKEKVFLNLVEVQTMHQGKKLYPKH
jgi:hypothetical protein